MPMMQHTLETEGQQTLTDILSALKLGNAAYCRGPLGNGASVGSLKFDSQKSRKVFLCVVL